MINYWIYIALVVFFIVFAIFIFNEYVLKPFFRRVPINFTNKHILISGGSKGIGLAIAKSLSTSYQCKITLMARSEFLLDEAKKSILNTGIKKKISNENKNIVDSNIKECEITEEKTYVMDPSHKCLAKIFTISCDVCSNMEHIQKSYKKAVEQFGPVDILINCAGYAKCGYFSDMEIDDFENSMNVNYFGSLKLTKLFISEENCNQRVLVYFSSIAGQLGIVGYSAYSPTKFAIEGLSQVISMELAYMKNLNILTVYPPDTDTPGYKEENISKPTVTNIISGKAGLYSAESVATAVINAIKKRQTRLYFGFNGNIIGILTAGTSIPRFNIFSTLLEIFSMGILRLIFLLNLNQLYNIVKKFKSV